MSHGLISLTLIVAGFWGCAFCELLGHTISTTTFSFNLFQRVFRRDQNVVISPISLQTSLAMFYPLAGDEVTPDMQRHLILDSNKQTEVGYIEDFVNDLNRDQTGSIKVRVKVYHVDAPLNPEVLPLMRDRFGAQVETADFHQVDAVVNSINKWVDQETNGLVEKYMEPGDLRVDSDLLLLNVAVLNASWAVPFKPSQTIPTQFHFVNGNRDVQMMHAEGEFLYAYSPQLKVHAVELLYEKDSDLSMIFILPLRKSSLEQIVAGLSTDFYTNLDEEFSLTMVDVFVPKFTARYKLDAKDVLKDMGLKSLFERFDLNILQRDRSRIGEVRQTTQVKVDEKGTVAVVVTEVQATGRSANPEFLANEPFLFLIRKRSNKKILFMGHYSVYEPNATETGGE